MGAIGCKRSSPGREIEQPAPLHNCEAPSGAEHGGHGSAVKCCFDRGDGQFWIDNGEHASRVSFCPYCGARAPKPIGEET